MSQLHEVLAVESSLESKSKKLVAETKKTLGKESLFQGQVRSLAHFLPEDAHLDTVEHMELSSTVSENLEYTTGAIVDYWDIVLQKEATNQVATADLVVDGQVIAEGIPATFLLGMEKRLVDLRSIYEAVHTLPPSKKWIKDSQATAGVYVTANDEVTFKEVKTPKYVVAYEATNNHPAQVHERMDTEKVAKYTTTQQSGLWTPLKKAKALENIDTLIMAVKKARQRANRAEVVGEKIGSKLFDFINS